VARAEIDGRIFYLLELQRKKILRNKAYGEGKISGLLIEIKSDSGAVIEISRVCDEIRFSRGNFRTMNTEISFPNWVFRHVVSAKGEPTQ